jgi:hypothetical protein
MQSVRGSASMTICAILTDSEGAASPLRFLTEILLLYTHDRLGPFITEHATVEEIEEDSYKAIPEHLALPPQEILVLAEREEGLSLLRPWGWLRYALHARSVQAQRVPSLKTSPPSVLGDTLMAHFTLETRNSARLEVTGKDGATLIKAIRKAGVEELVSQCGGVAPARPATSMSPCPMASRFPPWGLGKTACSRRIASAPSHRGFLVSPSSNRDSAGCMSLLRRRTSAISDNGRSVGLSRNHIWFGNGGRHGKKGWR